MVNVPLKKKKKVQVSSPGRATPAPKYKSDERGDVFAFTRNLRVCTPKVSTFRILRFRFALLFITNK